MLQCTELNVILIQTGEAKNGAFKLGSAVSQNLIKVIKANVNVNLVLKTC